MGHEHVLEAVQRRLEEHPEKIRQRRETVEHPFGTINARMGAEGYVHSLRPRLGSIPTRFSSTRQSQSKPQLDELKARMEEIRAKLSAKSALAVAISYALKRWLALTRYLDDGHLEIDNLIAARYFYSNSGYLMLAGIIEKVSQEASEIS